MINKDIERRRYDNRAKFRLNIRESAFKFAIMLEKK